MWDLFDFNNDGKTSLFEKVVGLELLDSTIHDTNSASNNSEFDDVLDGDDSSDFDEDDEVFDDDDDDFSNEEFL